MPPLVVFRASDVAALLGRHRHRRREEALLQTLMSQKCAEQDQLRQELRPHWEALSRRLPETPAIRLLAASDASVDGLRVETMRRDFKDQAEAALKKGLELGALQEDLRLDAERALINLRLLRDTLKQRLSLLSAVKPARLSGSFLHRHALCVRRRRRLLRLRDRLLEVEERLLLAGDARRLERALSSCREMARSCTRAAALPPGKLEAALEEEVAVRRGIAQESLALDALAARRGNVTERNDRLHYIRGDGFLVSGRIDGYIAAENTVVEAKVRRTWPSSPPDYDLLQLGIYLQMRGAARGLLAEWDQASGDTRETLVNRGDFDWPSIMTALKKAAEQVRSATAALALSWMETARVAR